MYKKGIILSLCCTALFLGCGGDGDAESSTSITSISPEPNILSVGGKSVVTFGLSYSAGDTFTENDRVGVTILIPAGLQFKTGSAEVERAIDDQSIAPSGITNCPDGSSFVSFSLSQDDLVLATNPRGNTDAEIRMELDSIAALGSVTVAASSSINGVAFSCGSPFASQNSAVILLQ